METELIKGEVEKVWHNKTSAGKRYDVIEVAGGRYSVWDGEYLGKIEKGEMVEFEYKQSGNFNNVLKFNNGSQPEPDNGKDYIKEPNTTAGNGNGYSGDRMQQMARMSGLKTAGALIAGSKVPYVERADKTIEMAMKFEKYINGDLDLNLDGDLPEVTDTQK
jgi:hypothetical protein